jgi:hypothetical protein
MKLKRLFQVLVLGGSTLVALSACGSDSSNPPPGGTSSAVAPAGQALLRRASGP